MNFGCNSISTSIWYRLSSDLASNLLFTPFPFGLQFIFYSISNWIMVRWLKIPNQFCFDFASDSIRTQILSINITIHDFHSNKKIFINDIIRASNLSEINRKTRRNKNPSLRRKCLHLHGWNWDKVKIFSSSQLNKSFKWAQYFVLNSFAWIFGRTIEVLEKFIFYNLISHKTKCQYRATQLFQFFVWINYPEIFFVLGLCTYVSLMWI